jgi:hypothetical protein
LLLRSTKLPVAAVVGAKNVPVVCFISCIAKAEPAELVFANNASHVVASFIFLDFGLADRAELDSTIFSGNPAF